MHAGLALGVHPVGVGILAADIHGRGKGHEADPQVLGRLVVAEEDVDEAGRGGFQRAELAVAAHGPGIVEHKNHIETGDLARHLRHSRDVDLVVTDDVHDRGVDMGRGGHGHHAVRHGHGEAPGHTEFGGRVIGIEVCLSHRLQLGVRFVRRPPDCEGGRIERMRETLLDHESAGQVDADTGGGNERHDREAEYHADVSAPVAAELPDLSGHAAHRFQHVFFLYLIIGCAGVLPRRRSYRLILRLLS